MTKKKTIELETGITVRVDARHPYKFLIGTSGGTVIEGRATPENPLTITPGGDITEFRITMDKDSFAPPRLVKK